MCRPRTRPAAQSGLQMPSTRLGRWSPGGSRHCVGRRWRPRATSARVWGRTAARRTARHWTAHLAHGSDGRGGGTRLIWVSLRTARRPRGGVGCREVRLVCARGPPGSHLPSGRRELRNPVVQAGVCGGCVRRVWGPCQAGRRGSWLSLFGCVAALGSDFSFRMSSVPASSRS